MEITGGLLEANLDSRRKETLRLEDIIATEDYTEEEFQEFDFKKELVALRKRNKQERSEQERQKNEIMNTLKLLKEELEDLKKVTIQNTYDLAYLKSKKLIYYIRIPINL